MIEFAMSLGFCQIDDSHRRAFRYSSWLENCAIIDIATLDESSKGLIESGLPFPGSSPASAVFDRFLEWEQNCFDVRANEKKKMKN
jgi:hypothetical protein